MPYKNKILPPALITIALTCMIITSCGTKNPDRLIIISETPDDISQRDFLTGDSWRYLPGSRLIEVDRLRPENRPEILTLNFFSACSPEISPDGKLMVFSGQVKKDDPWQIWIMNLSDKEINQVTRLEGNCTDPAFLPGNRILFSMINPKDTLKAGHSLYTCNTEGSDLRRITFSPHTWFASHVLKDGRILVSGTQIFPEIKKQQYMVLRPDGTKADLFYAPERENNLVSRPRETGSNKILFVESSKNNPGKGDLISITYNRPLHSRINLSEGSDGDFLSVFPEKSGKFLVSYRKSPSGKFGLCEFDPETRSVDQEIYSDPGYNVAEAVLPVPYQRPRLLPSEVDMHVKTGLIMCQDINVIDPGLQSKLPVRLKYDKIELIGLDSSLGIVNVDDDGSFYLKAKADSPFRIRVLDEKGNPVNEPCDWIWLRPNERRGCVGCHEDHEIAPENRVPLAVRRSPVVVPVHIEKLKEKTVELE